MTPGRHAATVSAVQDGNLWLAVASTLALVGVIWQLALALKDGVDSMESFLAAKNTLMREERARIRDSVPRWRVRKRRQMLKAVEGNARQVLTIQELNIERRFDRQSYAWALVSSGALVATIGSWLLVSGRY
jgi:hypothetical protein